MSKGHQTPQAAITALQAYFRLSWPRSVVWNLLLDFNQTDLGQNWTWNHTYKMQNITISHADQIIQHSLHLLPVITDRGRISDPPGPDHCFKSPFRLKTTDLSQNWTCSHIHTTQTRYHWHTHTHRPHYAAQSAPTARHRRQRAYFRELIFKRNEPVNCVRLEPTVTWAVRKAPDH